MAALYRVATFNIEYRLRQEGGGYPENLKDVRCALAWITADAPAIVAEEALRRHRVDALAALLVR